MRQTPSLVMVTGASGHVGASLVRSLLRRGNRVRVLVHVDTAALDGLEVDVVRGDITDPSSLGAALRDVHLVYHCAACISVSGGGWDSLRQRNVEGTRNVIDACIQNDVRRLIHFSSIHATADPGPVAVIDEQSPLAAGPGAAPYDRSKAEAEQVVLAAVHDGLDAVVVAPTAVVGPHDYRPSHFGRVLLALAQGRMPAVVQGGYDWVDVRDVVDGAIVAASVADAGSKFMLSGHWYSLSGVASMVSETRGCRAPRVCLPSHLARAAGAVNESFCRARGVDTLFTRFSVEALSSHRKVSHEKAARKLGYNPRPLRETIVDTIRWFEDTGYLTPCRSRESA